ncbi:33 kDa protein [Fowl aviadenovirus C]|uniref:22 kDa protein n=3 Tax=Fowl aviadenovirus C TaxID=190063 RepID=A0A096ZH05_9ADEN|nr:33kDa protein [Fowl aviadenovirus C]ANV21400.1 22 KDa protein [Fowl aviadenovirus 4]AWW22463.1 33K [Fowl adenovirus]AMB36754.1 33 kDa protein [Fowl aviadenovirus C]AMQ81272.1 33kDa protein [Fowl aviadenovirus C]
MAQRMVDLKARASEPPEPEIYNPEEATESDGETLGSEDTDTEEDQMSTISEEEEEEEDEAYSADLAGEDKENSPPTIPPKRSRNASSVAPSQALTRPPLRTNNTANTSSTARRIRPQRLPDRAPRGNYRSWARYRVAICQALRDTVFDRVQAAQVLKNTRQLYVPASVLAYYARKLLAMTDDSAFTHSCEGSQR